MNHALKSKRPQNQDPAVAKWPAFTPPQSTAQAALCGLFLLRRLQDGASAFVPQWEKQVPRLRFAALGM